MTQTVHVRINPACLEMACPSCLRAHNSGVCSFRGVCSVPSVFCCDNTLCPDYREREYQWTRMELKVVEK